MIRDGVANVINALRKAGFAPHKVGPDAWQARCPAHKGLDATLGVTRNEFNHVVLECNSAQKCQYIPIIKSLGLSNDAVYAETPDWLIRDLGHEPIDHVIGSPEPVGHPHADRDFDGQEASIASALAGATDRLSVVAALMEMPTAEVSAAAGDPATLADIQHETSIQVLLRLAAGARLFHSEDGRFLAQVPVRGRVDVYGLKSPAFRDWLVAGYQGDQNQPPHHASVQRVVGLLEAQARFDTTIPPIFVRVGHDVTKLESACWLDLGDATGRAIRIGTGGWSIVDQPAIHFRRSAGHLPLVAPARNGSIDLLRRYVNVSDPDFRLLVSWLTAALRPIGPYPVLVLQGEQGSAKSTLAKVLRSLVDPQSCPLLSLPKSTRDLVATAVNGWLLAYDNVSKLPQWLSDAFCQLVYGLGFSSRTLFTDDERTVIHARRPVILNGIEDFVTRGDLRDRSVFLHLPRIIPSRRIGEDEFWDTFHADCPRILGGLLDGIVAGMSRLPSVRLTETPRMADYAKWGEAFGRGVGWGDDTFLTAYNANRKDATDSILDDSPLARVLLQVAVTVPVWSGSPHDLYRKLSTIVGRNVASSAGWPRSLLKFSNELRRLAPQLALHGCAITFDRKHSGRSVTIKAEETDTPITGDRQTAPP